MAVTAKFEADFSSFLSAIDKADVKLADFGKGASKVESSLNRMVDNFSGRKLIQEASLMTIAIEKAGGTSKLTASELERVGAKANEAADKLKKLGYDVPPGLQKLADETKRLSTESTTAGLSFGKLVASYVTGQAVIGAAKAVFGAFTGELARSVTAASEAEKAHVQVVAALRAQGTAVPSVVTAYSNYASALQRTTIFQDDALEGAQALLVQVGNVMPRDMEKALVAVTNLASGLGVDLNTATLQVAKAAEGNTGALKKAGVVIDETKAKAEGFAYVLDQINAKFAGQAEAVAGTYQGRLEQLGNTWNNVEESIGRVITQNATVLAVFDAVNKSIDAQTGELKDNQTATNFVSDAVIIAVQSMGLFAKSLDVIQTVSAGFIIGLRTIASGLGNIGVAALEASKAVSLATGNFGGVAAANAGIKSLQAAVKELGDRNEQTTQRSVRLGTTLDDIAAKTKTLVADLEKTRGKTIELKDATDKATDAWSRNTKATANVAKDMEKARKEQEKFNAELERSSEAARRIEPYFYGVAGAVTAFDNSELEAVKGSIALYAEIQKVEQTVRIAQFGFKGFTEELSNVGEKAPVVAKQISTLGLSIQNDLLSVLKGIPQTLANAFTGGGGLAGAIKSIASGLGSAIGSAIGKTFQSLGNLGGPIGAALGSLAGPLVGFIGKLFGNNPEKQINPIREAFVQAAGGLAELNKKAFAATGSLQVVQNLLNAKNPKDYEKALSELNQAFADFDGKVKTAQGSLDSITTRLGKITTLSPELRGALDKAFSAGNIDQFNLALGNISGILDDEAAHQQRVNDLVSKYGLNWTDAGSKFKQAKVNEIASGLIDDFNDLKGVFDNLNPVMEGMKEPLNDFIKKAKEAGVEVPDSMKPLLQTAIDAGVLFDANGKKITDMKDLGITFGTTMEKEMKNVVDAIGKLIDTLNGKLTPALDTATKDRSIRIGFDVDDLHLPDVPSDWDLGAGAIRMATGGMGRVNKPTLFLAGEAGPEDFSFTPVGSRGGASEGSAHDDVRVVVINGSGMTSDQIVEAVNAQFSDAVLGNKGGFGTKLKSALGLQTTRWTAA